MSTADARQSGVHQINVPFELATPMADSQNSQDLLDRNVLLHTNSIPTFRKTLWVQSDGIAIVLPSNWDIRIGIPSASSWVSNSIR